MGKNSSIIGEKEKKRRRNMRIRDLDHSLGCVPPPYKVNIIFVHVFTKAKVARHKKIRISLKDRML